MAGQRTEDHTEEFKQSFFLCDKDEHCTITTK